MRLIHDLGMEPDDIRVLILAWKCNCKKQVCVFAVSARVGALLCMSRCSFYLVVGPFPCLIVS